MIILTANNLDMRKSLTEPSIKIEKSIGLANPIMEKIRNLVGKFATKADIEYVGLENLRNLQDKNILFAVGPHNSHLDTIFSIMGIAEADKNIKSKTIPVAARDYWGPEPLRTLSKLFVRFSLMSRNRGEQTQLDKKTVEDLIANGFFPLILPEGTRKEKYKTPVKDRKYHTGIAQFAVNTRKHKPVIIPIYLRGVGPILPKGSFWPKNLIRLKSKRFKVQIVIGRPIEIANQIPPNFAKLKDDEQYEILKMITAQIKGFMEAQEEFSNRGQSPVEPY